MADTSSEQWRRECEARAVAKWSKLAREKFYSMVEKSRGVDSAAQLVSDVEDVLNQTRRPRANP